MEYLTIGIVFYIAIGILLFRHMAGNDVKKHPDIYVSRIDFIKFSGFWFTIIFVLLWIFALDIIFKEDL